MARFDARRFGAEVRALLRNSPWGMRSRLEAHVPSSTLCRVLGGHEVRINHILVICDFFGLTLDTYVQRGTRQRDWIIV